MQPEAREPQKLPLWEAATNPKVGGEGRGAGPPGDMGTHRSACWDLGPHRRARERCNLAGEGACCRGVEGGQWLPFSLLPALQSPPCFPPGGRKQGDPETRLAGDYHLCNSK